MKKKSDYICLIIYILIASHIPVKAEAQIAQYEQSRPLVINAGSGMILNSAAIEHWGNNEVLQSFNKKEIRNSIDYSHQPHIKSTANYQQIIQNTIVASDNIIVINNYGENTSNSNHLESDIYILKNNGHCYRFKPDNQAGPRIRVSKRFCQVRY